MKIPTFKRGDFLTWTHDRADPKEDNIIVYLGVSEHFEGEIDVYIVNDIDKRFYWTFPPHFFKLL